MLKNVEKTGVNTSVLHIEVQNEEFAEGLEKSYKKNVKNINVPGFRKGKAPRKMIEKMFGIEVFFEDAVNFTYQKAYSDALEESGLIPVAQAQMEIDGDVTKTGYTFNCTVITKPVVKLGDYESFRLKPEVSLVTDEEIDKEVERAQIKVSRLEAVEREAIDGDTAVINFDGFVDDVAFEGGKGENYSLKIGSGQFIPGFEEQLIGKKAGEDCDVNVKFPDEYHSEELKGKEAIFKVNVLEVKETILPEINDEFVKDISEFDTVSQYRDDIKAKLQERSENISSQEFERKVLENLTSVMEAEIPEEMIESQLDKIVSDFEYRVQSQGMNFEQYLGYTGTNIDEFRANFKDQALNQVKTNLSLEAVAAAKSFDSTEEEVLAELTKLSEKYSMDIETIKKSFPKEMLENDMKIEKAVNYLKEIAQSEEPPAPKKKTRTKKAPAEVPAEPAM